MKAVRASGRTRPGAGWRSAALVAAGLALAGCDAGDQGTPREAPPPVVTVAPVKERPVRQSAEFVGRIEPISYVELRARVEGFLQNRNFVEGTFVRTGDVLFEIEPEPFEAALVRAEADVASAKAAVTEAENALKRAQQLIRRGNISQAKLDEAQASAEQTAASLRAREADLKQAQINLSYARIVAPIDGRIDRSVYSVGNLVSPESGVLATVTALDPIYVNFSISERALVTFAQEAARERRRTPTTPPAADAAEPETADTTDTALTGEIDIVKETEPPPEPAPPGNPPTSAQASPDVTLVLKLPNESIYPHEGLLTFIDTRIDPQTGTILLRGTMPNPDGILLPGQFVTVSIRANEAVSALTVPQAAIQRDQQGPFVLIVGADGTVQVRRIRTGVRDGTDWIVEDGLTEGELLIVQGLQKVRPGMTVKTVGGTASAEG